MSTEKMNTKIKKNRNKDSRFSQIARLGEDIFHAKDLANLWRIKSPNTLYTTLKRYVQKGWLFRIYKGLYSIKPLAQLDSLKLGIKALRCYAYVGTETILAHSGIIQQEIKEITMVSSVSRRFSIGNNHYYSRQLKDEYLFNDAGIKNENGLKIASVERAIADILYFNPRAYFDAYEKINWRKVKKIQKEIGYASTRFKTSDS